MLSKRIPTNCSCCCCSGGGGVGGGGSRAVASLAIQMEMAVVAFNLATGCPPYKSQNRSKKYFSS